MTRSKIHRIWAVAAWVSALSACGGGGSTPAVAVSAPPPAVNVALTCSAVGLAASSTSSKNTVCMLTDKGEVVLELDATKAPVTVANFLQYVNVGFYASTSFHRVVDAFVVQGGGYTYGNGSYALKATNAPIALESKAVSGLSNLRGTVAMARTSSPNSATSQFYINVGDNQFLDGSSTADGYAVFGKVISGMAVVDLISKVPVQSNGLEVSQPVAPVTIQWATQLK